MDEESEGSEFEITFKAEFKLELKTSLIFSQTYDEF
jgi:hypothetical protein